MITTRQLERTTAALDAFTIELPSWGFANSGTRFGKFIQPSAATTTEEKQVSGGELESGLLGRVTLSLETTK
jgi:L-rhamnose isomerase / sugar isomerase